MPKPKEPRKTKRHPLLQGRPKGVWCADLVGKIRGYPRTQEGFDARRANGAKLAAHINANGLTRHGIPDGWAGKRKEVIAIRAQAAVDADRIYMELVEHGIIDVERAVDGLPTDDASRAEHAMKGLMAITIDATQQTRDRLSAFQTLLTYTKSKPVVKTATVVSSAESFLDALLHGATSIEIEGEAE